MPNRPKEHELEDLSRAKFQLSLPRKWVFRDKNKDYGIDGEVELFDEDGNTKGLLFYVQLKATSSTQQKDILNINLKIDTLKYFNKLDIPVLLVRYSEHLDKFYIKWINSVDLFKSKEGAKTFRINLSDMDEWATESANLIEKDLENIKKIKSGLINFPFNYSLQINNASIAGISSNILKAQLRNELSKYSTFLEYNINDNLILISLENDILSIKISILKGLYFHNINKRPKENFIHELSKDILLGLSMCMVMIGKADYCGKIIFENSLEKSLLKKEELLLRILPVLISSSYFENILNFINDSFNLNENEIVLIPSMASILIHSSDKHNIKRNELIEKFFLTQLNKAQYVKSNILISTSHYNLGNYYRSRRENLKSIHQYVLAKRSDKDYLKRSYFYKEFGGLCFIENKFLFSSYFYKKSIALGASNDTKALLADALLFSGNYQESHEIFTDYLSDGKDLQDEFILKAIVLESLIKDTGIKGQKRLSNLANELADIGKIEDDKQAISNIELALNYDLLCSLAWFNLGILQKEQGDYSNAFFSFATCSIINLTDIQSWVYAFFSFLSSADKLKFSLGVLVLKTAHTINGDDFLIHLYENLEMNSQNSKDIIELIDNILSNNKNENDPIILRLLNGDKYEEIEIR